MAATTNNTGSGVGFSQVTTTCLAAAAREGNFHALKELLLRAGENPQTHAPQPHPPTSSSSSGTGSVAAGGGAESSSSPPPPPPPSAAQQQCLRGVTAEGDTALHLVAAGNGEEGSFKECAELINSTDSDLLTAQNNKGDTALHCAARAGKPGMVSLLIGLALAAGKKQELVRTMNNSEETALHEAIRLGDEEMVKSLLEADPELAQIPQPRDGGTSPLCLAILLREDKIAETLMEKYSGSINGLTALHAAVGRGPEVTKKVLEWNMDLARERDGKGSTPLHLAAGLPVHFAADFRRKLLTWISEDMDLARVKVCSQVLEANPAALYQTDNDGLFPIHVAASVGAVQAVAMFVERSVACAGLRNAKGKTFLHVAVEKDEVPVVCYACSNPKLAWIMNMRDNEGNTALHLAVHAGSLRTFSAIFRTRQVRLDLTDAKGETPRDVAEYKVPPRLSFELNSDSLIRYSLKIANASNGVSRRDHFRSRFEEAHRNELKEREMLKDSTQVLSVGSVLIVTVTFGATFALPGGYRADDYTHGGSPTLAGSYAFLAFMMANTVAFMCSSIATVGFMYAGSPMVHLDSRTKYIDASVYFMQASITSLAAAFALGMYTVLAPVAPVTAITICVIGPLVVAYSMAKFLFKASFLVRAFWVRKGPVWTLLCTVLGVLVCCLAFFWPVIFVFSWAAFPKIHHHWIPKMVPMAQPPMPLPQ